MARVCGVRFHGGEIGVHRRFGVHHDGAVVGHAHHHIGAVAAAVVRRYADLLFVVAVVLHARQFHHAAELHFAPRAAHFGTLERGGEAAGFGDKAAVVLLQRLDLFGETALRFVARFFDALEFVG